MNSKAIVIIGASTGGPRTLRTVLGRLPFLDNTSVIVIQHMPRHINESIRKSLARVTAMKVKLAEDGDSLKEGVIYLSPGDVHTKIENNQCIRLIGGEKVNFVRPSIDVAMTSLGADPLTKAIGVILTGMGSDGVAGISYIKRLGGATIAQNQASSVIYGMPKLAAETGDVDFILPPEKMGDKIAELVQAGKA